MSSIRKNIELKFMLKKLQEQLKMEHKEVILISPLPNTFVFTFDEDDQIQGAKAGIKNKEEVSSEVLTHNMKWTIIDKDMFLVGYGYNNTKCLKSEKLFTRLSILMGRSNDSIELSHFLSHRSVLIVTNKKDVEIEGEGGRMQLLNSSNVMVDKEELEKKVAQYIEEQRLTNVKFPMKDEGYEERKRRKREEERKKWKREGRSRGQDERNFQGSDLMGHGTYESSSGTIPYSTDNEEHSYEDIERNIERNERKREAFQFATPTGKFGSPREAVSTKTMGNISQARAIVSGRNSVSKDTFRVNWNDKIPGDDFLQSSFPSKLQRREVESGGAERHIVGAALIDQPLSKKNWNALLDQPISKKDWNAIWPTVDKNLMRKEWSPGKARAIQMVRDALDIHGPEHTSTPMDPKKSKTEEHRQILADNVESVEKITSKIRSLQLERDTDEDSDPDDHLMLDFTTDLAQTMPSILEGDYDQRLATVIRLSKSTAELLTKKSRRLAGLQPEMVTEMMDKKEQKRLEWNMFIDKIEKEHKRKEKRDDEQIRVDTEEY